MSEKISIRRDELLKIANTLIQNHEDCIQGMYTDVVEEKAGVLVFKGEYFLCEKGMPTTKTTSVFNMFKFLAEQLSKKYTIYPK